MPLPSHVVTIGRCAETLLRLMLPCKINESQSLIYLSLCTSLLVDVLIRVQLQFI